MELALVYTKNNLHPRCGIFIKHASPQVWLQEIKRMQLCLSDCTAYACPGKEANSISGVLLIFKTAQKNIAIGSNSTVQKVHENFFIPENTMLNMALTAEEFSKLLKGIPHFFHHEFGMMELNEVLDWTTITQNPTEQFPTIEMPSKGVKIPNQVTVFSVEIEEAEEAEEALGNPFGEEKIDPKDLPFDMKKVLQGNNTEIEKYLKYLEKYPNTALKMAVPLNMMGTSRGKAFAEYKFKSSFFESLGFGNSSTRKNSLVKTIIGILAIILLFWVGYKVIQVVDAEKSNIKIVNPKKSDLEPNEDLEIIGIDDMDEDNVDVDTTRTKPSQESTSTTTPQNTIIQNVLLFIVILVLLFLILYLSYYRKQKELEKQLQRDQSWIDLPDESELFDIYYEESQKEKDESSSLYFGGDEISFKNKIILVLIIIALLVYLFYPTLQQGGFPIAFGVIAAIIVVRVLYSLVNKNHKFDKDDA